MAGQRLRAHIDLNGNILDATTLLLSMLIQKTLHMRQSLAECKARLTSIQWYRRQFLMVTGATVISPKAAYFSFRGPLGFEGHTALLSVENDSSHQYSFESVGGNINLMGIVDFAEIRPNCTEVTLAVHYEITNKLFAWLDRRLRFLDAFVTAELRSIRALENGSAGRDALEHKTTADQIGALSRWNKGEQTA